MLFQLLNKCINNLLDQRFLILQAPVAERISEILAHSRMSLRIPLRHDRQRLRGEVAALIELGLDEGLVTFAGAVDVSPGLRGVEAEFVRCDADDGAYRFAELVGSFKAVTCDGSTASYASAGLALRTVFLVEFQDFVRLSAAHEAAGVGKLCPGI